MVGILTQLAAATAPNGTHRFSNAGAFYKELFFRAARYDHSLPQVMSLSQLMQPLHHLLLQHKLLLSAYRQQVMLFNACYYII